MALTTAQIVDCRRFMGFGILGDTATVIFSLPAFSKVGVAGAWVGISLVDRLQHLQAAEETVLINTYLTPIAALETAIITAASNLDTNKAAVWERNTNEIQDRTDLFNATRLRLCAFLGFAPGPELAGSNTTSLRRC